MTRVAPLAIAFILAAPWAATAQTEATRTLPLELSLDSRLLCERAPDRARPSGPVAVGRQQTAVVVHHGDSTGGEFGNT